MANTPKFSGTFGVEIEVLTRLSRSEVARLLSLAGIPAFDAGYTHRVSNSWKVVSDATVIGCEVVSPILNASNPDDFAAIETVCEVLTEAGCTVNRTCGLHVHFGIGDLNLKEMKRIAKNFVKYEDSIELLIAQSRRGNAHWARSAVLHYSDDVSTRAMTVNQVFARIDAARDVRGIEGACGGRGKINFGAYFRHGTLEIRAHQGTLNATKINNWIRLMGAVIQYAVNARTVRVRKAIAGQDVSFRLFWFLRYHAAGDLRKYWSKRFRALNPGMNMGTHLRWKNQAQKARDARIAAAAVEAASV